MLLLLQSLLKHVVACGQDHYVNRELVGALIVRNVASDFMRGLLGLFVSCLGLLRGIQPRELDGDGCFDLERRSLLVHTIQIVLIY